MMERSVGSVVLIYYCGLWRSWPGGATDSEGRTAGGAFQTCTLIEDQGKVCAKNLNGNREQDNP